MDDIGVFKTAHHVDDGVGFADVRQELVAQPFALAGARDQPGNVDKLDDGGQHAFGFDDFGQLRQTRIGHLDDAHIGLNGAEGVVFGGNASLGQGIEQGGFAHVGQPHDSTFQTHCFPLCAFAGFFLRASVPLKPASVCDAAERPERVRLA